MFLHVLENDERLSELGILPSLEVVFLHEFGCDGLRIATHDDVT